MKTILEEIKERLELVEKGQLPHCETDTEWVKMYRNQESVLAAIAAEIYRLRAELATERESYEACIAATRMAS